MGLYDKDDIIFTIISVVRMVESSGDMDPDDLRDFLGFILSRGQFGRTSLETGTEIIEQVENKTGVQPVLGNLAINNMLTLSPADAARHFANRMRAENDLSVEDVRLVQRLLVISSVGSLSLGSVMYSGTTRRIDNTLNIARHGSGDSEDMQSVIDILNRLKIIGDCVVAEDYGAAVTVGEAVGLEGTVDDLMRKSSLIRRYHKAAFGAAEEIQAMRNFITTPFFEALASVVSTACELSVESGVTSPIMGVTNSVREIMETDPNTILNICGGDHYRTDRFLDAIYRMAAASQMLRSSFLVGDMESTPENYALSVARESDFATPLLGRLDG